MLHLHPGVHLHKVDFVAGKQKLHRTGVLVTHRFRRLYRQAADVLALFRGKLRAGGDLDQLLVAALDGAVPLEQVDGIAVAVSQHLNLDMARVHNAFFHEHLGRTESLGGLGDHPRVLGFQLFRRITPANAPATTTGGGFQHHRVADLVGQLQRVIQVCQVALGTRGDGHTGRPHTVPGLGFVAHLVDNIGFGANKGNPVLLAQLGKAGILRQKTVAGMNGIAAGLQRQVHNPRRVQVAGQGVFAQ